MRLVRVGNDGLEAAGRGSLGAAQFGVPFFVLAACLAAFPLEALTLPQAAFAVGMLACAGLCVGFAYPRKTTIQYQAGERRLTVNGRILDCSEPPRLALAGGADSGGSGPLEFRLDLRLADGRAFTLAKDTDPAPVLRQANAVRGASGLPIEAAWGLPTALYTAPALSFPGESVPDSASVSEPGAVRVPDAARSGMVQLSIALSTLFVGGDLLFLGVTNSVVGAPSLGLSVALGTGAVAAMLFVLLAVRFSDTRLQLEPTVVRLERRALGRLRRALEIPREAVLGAFFVSPTPARAVSHVLLFTKDAVQALPCSNLDSRRAFGQWLWGEPERWKCPVDYSPHS